MTLYMPRHQPVKAVFAHPSEHRTLSLVTANLIKTASKSSRKGASIIDNSAGREPNCRGRRGGSITTANSTRWHPRKCYLAHIPTTAAAPSLCRERPSHNGIRSLSRSAENCSASLRRRKHPKPNITQIKTTATCHHTVRPIQ